MGDWARDTFGLDRDPYDRLGHLMQGFVPALLVRELLSRTSPLRGSRRRRRSPCAPASPSVLCSRCSRGRRP
ncbi:DUF2238 domain-containing protein [Streptomyces lacrimifluminis]|uniref:DUF2238 domain-containing protein n=1 Tax=Streptomyces lacrimifluminis TaxID=1500077 RepID=UPI00357123E0